MANLAIKGHATRGKEVIEILEMLGGENIYYYDGKRNMWYILEDNTIATDFDLNKEKGFTLEEFLKKYPYKVGDMVRVPEYESEVCIDDMRWHGFEIQYSVSADETESLYDWYSVEELNKCDEPHKEKIVEEKSVNHVYNVDDVDVISFDIAQKDIYELDLKDNFLVILREGKYYVERKKPKYPKTFIEVLNFWHPDRQIEDDYQRCYKKDLIEKFQDLLYARDAYWKIAGEEMGLGKPWKPDWTIYEYKYCLGTDKNTVINECFMTGNRILAFPTKKMRDIFYKNFEYLIEECKEFL